eukprot:Partr_v1_DN25288_c0_g1_i1_m16949
MYQVFVHHTAIQNNGGFKSLGEGEEVEYDLVQGFKGLQAANVSGPNGQPVIGDTGPRQFPSGKRSNPSFVNMVSDDSGVFSPYSQQQYAYMPQYFRMPADGNNTTQGSGSMYAQYAMQLPDGSYVPVMLDPAGNPIALPPGSFSQQPQQQQDASTSGHGQQ